MLASVQPFTYITSIEQEIDWKDGNLILAERTKERGMMDKPEEAAGSQKTPVSNKERTSAKDVVRISLGAAIGVLITTIGLGYLIGRINSPNWEDPINVHNFIATHYSGRFLETAGRQPLPKSDPIELRFRLGDRYLVYRTDTEKITEEVLPIDELLALSHQPGRSKENQSLLQNAFALGAVAVAPLNNVRVSLGSYVGKAGKGKFAGVATAAVVLGAGGFLGYHFGFKGDPDYSDYSSKPFQEMRSEKALWRRIAEHYRTKSSRAPSSAAPSATP